MSKVASVRRRLSAVTLLAASIAACQRASDRPVDVVIDTLDTGRIVVQNLGDGTWTTETAWRLEPVVRIGVLDGPEPYVFGRVIDVALGPDELIYVLDSQAAEVRVFDLSGEHARTIGGPGQGPGELSGPYSLAFDAEGILWVPDERNRRYTAYSTLGETVRTIASPFRGGQAGGRVRWTGGGTLFEMGFVSGLGTSVLSLSFEDDAVIEDATPLPTWTPPGLFYTAESGERMIQAPPVPLRRTWDFTPAGRFWTGVGESYVLHEISLHGDTLRTVSRSLSPTRFSAEDEAALSDWIVEVRAQGYNEGDEDDLPREYPYFERIVVSDDAYVWVYRGIAAPGQFDVFDPEGRYLGVVVTTLGAESIGVQPHIAADRVVWVATDALGVPFVEVSEIVRP